MENLSVIANVANSESEQFLAINEDGYVIGTQV